MIYTLHIKRSAQKSLSKIPNPHQKNIIISIRNLAKNPRPNGVKKLTGRDAWRIRIGSYRVIYEIDDNILNVIVINIGHRKDIYKI